VEIKIKLNKIPDCIKPDMTADVNIIISNNSNCLVIPKKCIFPEGEKKYVMVMKNGKREKIEIETGLADIEFIEIKKGLSTSDMVIINPQDGK
jgi:multidrug efflux pump subunit AcrA (membrane-fusion protein)